VPIDDNQVMPALARHLVKEVPVNLPWRRTGPVQVTLEKRVLRVGSHIYPVSAMTTVHVDTWAPRERWQAWRRLRRTGIYPALPFAGVGIEFLRASRTDTPIGGLLLGVSLLILGVGLGLYASSMRRPALFELVAVIAGQRRGLFSCRDHATVWAIHDQLVGAMNNTGPPTSMAFTINGGQGFQFGNGNTQHNSF
jgi:hypothetical protein